MKNIANYLILCCGFFLFNGCVSQQAYQELEEENKYYKMEAEAADSLRNTNRGLYTESRQTEAQLRNTLRELEQMTVANESLNRSYQDLLEKYNRVLDQNRDVLSTTSYEKQNLMEQLAAKEAELDARERQLENMAYDLSEREQRLRTIEQSYAGLEGNLVERNARIQELEAMVNLKEGNMAELRSRISNALRGFSASDLSVTERKGRLYVSLSQELLFPSGSKTIPAKGRQALRQLSEVLRDNPDLDIMVEGHTDTDGSAAANWDLSVLRATAVAKELTNSGVSPERLTAAGRAFYDPIAPNNTTTGKAQNRRTEIILSPDLDELYDLLNSPGAGQ